MTELERIEQLEKEIRKLKGLTDDGKFSISFSQIKFSDLKRFVDIEINLDETIFEDWLTNDILLDKSVEDFLIELLKKTKPLMRYYQEERLKAKFIIPILNKIDFNINNISDFYNEKLTYETDKFIFNGEVDFMLAKGLIDSEKPYFFIQEFKRGKKNSDPEPQLLAELISGVELNNWSEIKGAYIIGATWNFVILKKLGKDRYQYFVSCDFNSTNIKDLKDIYRNLLFIKNSLGQLK